MKKRYRYPLVALLTFVTLGRGDCRPRLRLAGKEAAAVWDKALARPAFYSGGRAIPSSTAYAFVYPACFPASGRAWC